MIVETNDSAVELDRCILFLNSIGIETVFKNIDYESFLPGISIEDGVIVIDKEKFKYPGDILHEAGHIAVVPLDERVTLNAQSIEKRSGRESEEMMAIAWSYAACLHLNIDPYFVFHENGYKGGGNYIADQFNAKQYFGVPMLQWIGLCVDEKNAANLHVDPYPKMIKWVLT
jgi:hypothetical protein